MAYTGSFSVSKPLLDQVNKCESAQAALREAVSKLRIRLGSGESNGLAQSCRIVIETVDACSKNIGQLSKRVREHAERTSQRDRALQELQTHVLDLTQHVLKLRANIDHCLKGRIAAPLIDLNGCDDASVSQFRKARVSWVPITDFPYEQFSRISIPDRSLCTFSIQVVYEFDPLCFDRQPPPLRAPERADASLSKVSETIKYSLSRQPRREGDALQESADGERSYAPLDSSIRADSSLVPSNEFAAGVASNRLEGTIDREGNVLVERVLRGTLEWKERDGKTQCVSARWDPFGCAIRVSVKRDEKGQKLVVYVASKNEACGADNKPLRQQWNIVARLDVVSI